MKNLNSKTIFSQCFYCVEYNKIYPDYPLNNAVYDEFNDLTPRCNLHWEYKCNKCNKDIHFNGISYCNECNSFTCVRCGDEKLQMEEFFFYKYYYMIKCMKCSKFNPTLDYLEFKTKHPVQTGRFQLENQTLIWFPQEPITYKLPPMEEKPWGSKRITSIAINNQQIELTEENDLSSEEIWNAKSKLWIENMTEDGDFHHREIINPTLLKLLNLEKYEYPGKIKILDIGCGSGEFTRKVARMGFNITGIDVSNELINLAKMKNKEFNLDVNYEAIDAIKVSTLFQENTFDIIYSNMALMDMAHFEYVFQAVSEILKEGGVFVFSVSHPIFSWPVAQTIRIPKDSQRNEDKFWIIDRYWRNKTLIKFDKLEDSWLYYPKTFSQYLNECINNDLQIIHVEEPKVTNEDIKKYPRDHYFDNDRRPDFLFVKTKKKRE